MIQLTRNCPECNVEIIYKNSCTFYSARKKGKICRKCASIKSGFLDRYATNKNSGVNNAFFGKKHCQETKNVLSKVDKSKYKTDEFKSKMKEVVKRGEEHPMHNSSVYNFWVINHGQKRADELIIELKKKQSANSSGANNPMYGKPSPQGSGYGWKGWYKNWFFRSLRELSYAMQLDTEHKNWKSAEVKDFAILYKDHEGKERNYFADFIVDDVLLIEIKPVRLHSSPSVKAKSEAAKSFCEQKGMTYQIIDPIRLTSKEIKNLHTKGVIKFTEKYEQRYQQQYGGKEARFT